MLNAAEVPVGGNAQHHSLSTPRPIRDYDRSPNPAEGEFQHRLPADTVSTAPADRLYAHYTLNANDVS